VDEVEGVDEDPNLVDDFDEMLQPIFI